MEKFDVDRDEVIRKTREAGIGMLCVGVDLPSSRLAIELAERYEGIWASVGLHPNDNLTEAYSNASYKEIATNPRVVAIGEIGLDYYRTKDGSLKKTQRERFLMQLELARELDKPVIIHCRDAHMDMKPILAEAGLLGVVHSFNGSVDDMRAYIDGGFYIGMNAIVTYSPQYVDIIKAVPIDRLVLETDAPYLAPAPHRGARNEPVYISNTAEYIAKVKNETPESMLRITTLNASTLFNIGI